MPGEWWLPLRQLNDHYFEGPSSGIGWEGHVQALNSTYGISGDHELGTFPKKDLPPSWFIGDITAVNPGRWTLVLSLNPAWDKSGPGWYDEQDWNRDSFWDFQLNLMQSWNWSFHGSLSRLAMSADGISSQAGEDANLKEFAATHLVFAEVCPYASKRFSLPRELLVKVHESDIAFQVEAEMITILLGQGKPSRVFVNGNQAIASFQTIYGEALKWTEQCYESLSKPGKTLWHMQGIVDLGGTPVPIAGFPFLRKARTHNSHIEIEQLGRLIGEAGMDDHAP